MPPPSFRVCEITSCLHFLCVALPACRVHRQDRRESDLPVLHFNPQATLVWRCLPTPDMQISQLTNNFVPFFFTQMEPIELQDRKPETHAIEWNISTFSLSKVVFFVIFLPDRFPPLVSSSAFLSCLHWDEGSRNVVGGCIVRSLFSCSECPECTSSTMRVWATRIRGQLRDCACRWRTFDTTEGKKRSINSTHYKLRTRITGN